MTTIEDVLPYCGMPKKVRCVVCGSPYNIQGHHVLRRSQGGGPMDVVPVCRVHHDWVHANPLKAMELGLLERRGNE